MTKEKKKVKRRANGEGTIYQLKDGRYGAAISLGYDENGNRIRPKITGKSEDEVKEKMQALLKKMEVIDVSQPIVINSQSTSFLEAWKKSLMTRDVISSLRFF
jgi:hypothetical protein